MVAEALLPVLTGPYRTGLGRLCYHSKESGMEHQKTSLRASGQPEWGFVRASLYCTMESILGQRHRHKDFFQVFKVLEGEGEIEIGG